ncbi:TetR/AcrR family transcriptional regulator [Maricaulis sp.]|uniref:TetR/AcrR family transcriptional regulator n=1 Tax=Maricaulis sp. TaxID=1486257 RepID=UPI001B044404|nr:TetR/AcrR family transcriptional regulator [Maricaulis sp.]MBO6764806.1 TetR/AcrR family transcriptional regulator [Maricaulis sp.]
MNAPLASTRDKLMRSALELVAEDGFSAATTAAIAKRAGVAEGTLYRHFDSKDALFVAVYSGIKEAVYRSVMAETDDSGSFRDRFRQLWRGVWNAYRADPAAFTYGQRFSEYPLSDRDSTPIHDGFVRHIRTLIEDGQAHGEIKDIPGTVLTAFFFPPMVSMLKQANAGRDWTASEIDMAIETAWDSWRLNR